MRKVFRKIVWPVRKAWNGLMHWIGDSTVRLIIVVIFFLVCIPFSVYNVSILDNVTHAQRQGCVRNQPTKVALVDLQDTVNEFLVHAEEARQTSADTEKGSDPDQATIDFKAAGDYSDLQDGLIKSQQTLVDANATVAVTPGSIKTDCDTAYPRPWPLSLFS